MDETESQLPDIAPLPKRVKEQHVMTEKRAAALEKARQTRAAKKQLKQSKPEAAKVDTTYFDKLQELSDRLAKQEEREKLRQQRRDQGLERHPAIEALNARLDEHATRMNSVLARRAVPVEGPAPPAARYDQPVGFQAFESKIRF